MNKEFEIVQKEEVEEYLGVNITDKQFEEAMESARIKQNYLYERYANPVMLQHWYLVKLVEEHVISHALTKLTMDLCDMHYNMKKEYPFKEQGTHPHNHIVSYSYL